MPSSAARSTSASRCETARAERCSESPLWGAGLARELVQAPVINAVDAESDDGRASAPR